MMKMRLLKKAIPVLIALFLILIPTAVFANDNLRASDKTFVQGSVFTAEELKTLNDLASQYEETAGASLYVVVKDAGDAEERSAAAAELRSLIEADGGYGDQHRGIILFVNTSETNRSFAVVEQADDDGSEKLKNTDALTEEGSKIYKLLQDKKYAEAAKQFLTTVNSKLKPNFFKSIWMKLIAALGVGGAASGLAVGSHKAKPVTKKRHYLKDGNISVLRKNERLENTKITRKAAPDTQKTDQKLDEKSHGSGNKL